jgi:hypothetical protein
VIGYGYDAVSPSRLTPRGNITTMTDALNQVTTYASNRTIRCVKYISNSLSA